MKTKERVGRAITALVLALLYALSVEDLMAWLGPGRFVAVSVGVLAVMWLLAETSPHTVRYVAAPSAPAGERERMTAGEVLWIAALVIVLVSVLVAVLPSLIF